jgi:cadmium resistance protein CadD (predicted permease)
VIISDRFGNQDCGLGLRPRAWGLVTVTLAVIFVLVLLPVSRRALRELLGAIFGLLGIAFLITKDAGGRRSGF